MSTANLRGHLREQGYEQDPDTRSAGRDRCEVYDLVASGTGTVRVSVYPDHRPGHDRAGVVVGFYDDGMELQWSAALSPAAPDAVAVAVAEAAEWQLAGRRGGPVTPAQVASAR